MNDVPAPLVPPDVDLRDFEFMPLSVIRLQQSDLVAVATPQEFRAAVLLWCAAWHQVPAASLPDDDAVLANLAGFGQIPGVSQRAWRKHRTGALRGWVKCSDGRLYHPVIAEKAVEAWGKRKNESRRGKAGAAARWKPEQSTSNASGIKSDATNNAKGNTSSIAQAVPKNGKGEGEGQRQGREKDSKPASTHSEPRPTRALLEFRSRIVKAFENSNSPNLPDTSRVEVWAAQGYDPELCVAVVAEGIARKPSISSLAYFDNAIREAHEKRAPAANGHVVVNGEPTEQKLHELYDFYQRNKTWPFNLDTFGTEPGTAGSKITKEMIDTWSRPSAS